MDRMQPLSFHLVVAAVLAATGWSPDTASSQADPHTSDPHDALPDVEVPLAVEEGVDYRIYDRWGNRTSVRTLVGSSVNEDVLLVGEEHGDRVGHAVEALILETVIRELGRPEATGRPVILSMEMFERDVQYVLDEYLAGLIGEEHFLRSARPWDDYAARYRPLVEMARENGIPVLAANAPRRYVNRVTNEGPESLGALSEAAHRFLPPLPYPGPSPLYREQWKAIMERTGPTEDRDYSLSPNAIHAQALWDASMGHAITQALVRRMDGFVVHVSGSFHVARGTGIPEAIDGYRPGTEVTTVVMTRVDDIDAWSADEHGPLADFVVLTRRLDEPSASPRPGR